MKCDDFLRMVRSRAGLKSKDEAMNATRATLEVLSQRLFGGEAHDLASQLPSEFQPFLQQVQYTDSFDLDEFFRRVSEREGVDLPTAARHARAVVSVLLTAVSPGEMEDVLSQLPDSYDPLFQLGFEGEGGISQAA